jgi:hypothetical protein
MTLKPDPEQNVQRPVLTAEPQKKDVPEQPAVILFDELQPTLMEVKEIHSTVPGIFTNDHTSKNTVDNQVDKKDAEEKTEWILSHHSVSTKEKKFSKKCKRILRLLQYLEDTLQNHQYLCGRSWTRKKNPYLNTPRRIKS